MLPGSAPGQEAGGAQSARAGQAVPVAGAVARLRSRGGEYCLRSACLPACLPLPCHDADSQSLSDLFLGKRPFLPGTPNGVTELSQFLCTVLKCAEDLSTRLVRTAGICFPDQQLPQGSTMIVQAPERACACAGDRCLPQSQPPAAHQARQVLRAGAPGAGAVGADPGAAG